MVPLLLNVLASEWLYLPPPLTEISGFHLSNFIMIVLIFSFFDLALDLVPPKFVIRRVLSLSEKCRLSFANPRFQFFRDPGTVSWVFLNYFSWKEGINSRSKFHHQQPELVFTILSIKNRVPVLLGHPAPPRTPCTVTHIAWLYFLNNRFVFGWYHWSGQNGIMIRWCDFGRCDTLNNFGLFVKNQSSAPESLVFKVTSCLRWLAWDIPFDFNPVMWWLKSPVIILACQDFFNTIDVICFGRLCGLIDIQIDSTSFWLQDSRSLHCDLNKYTLLLP